MKDLMRLYRERHGDDALLRLYIDFRFEEAEGRETLDVQAVTSQFFELGSRAQGETQGSLARLLERRNRADGQKKYNLNKAGDVRKVDGLRKTGQLAFDTSDPASSPKVIVEEILGESRHGMRG